MTTAQIERGDSRNDPTYAELQERVRDLQLQLAYRDLEDDRRMRLLSNSQTSGNQKVILMRLEHNVKLRTGDRTKFAPIDLFALEKETGLSHSTVSKEIRRLESYGAFERDDTKHERIKAGKKIIIDKISIRFTPLALQSPEDLRPGLGNERNHGGRPDRCGNPKCKSKNTKRIYHLVCLDCGWEDPHYPPNFVPGQGTVYQVEQDAQVGNALADDHRELLPDDQEEQVAVWENDQVVPVALPTPEVATVSQDQMIFTSEEDASSYLPDSEVITTSHDLASSCQVDASELLPDDRELLEEELMGVWEVEQEENASDRLPDPEGSMHLAGSRKADANQLKHLAQVASQGQPVPVLQGDAGRDFSLNGQGLLEELTDTQEIVWSRFCTVSSSDYQRMSRKDYESICWLAERVQKTDDIKSLYDYSYARLQALPRTNGQMFIPPRAGNLKKYYGDWLQQQQRPVQVEQDDRVGGVHVVPGTAPLRDFTKEFNSLPPVDYSYCKPALPTRKSASSGQGDISEVIAKLRERRSQRVPDPNLESNSQVASSEQETSG